jgi:hypothetical protein
MDESIDARGESTANDEAIARAIAEDDDDSLRRRRHDDDDENDGANDGDDRRRRRAGAPRLDCPGRHGLMRYVASNAHRGTCDGCGGRLRDGSSMWSCEGCDCDYCEGCAAARVVVVAPRADGGRGGRERDPSSSTSDARISTSTTSPSASSPILVHGDIAPSPTHRRRLVDVVPLPTHRRRQRSPLPPPQHGAPSFDGTTATTTPTAHMCLVPCTICDITVEMLVDTGAQMSIMSMPLVRRLGVCDAIDARYRGIAAGVGRANISGRLYGVPCRFGNGHVEFAMEFMVLDVMDEIAILGLDQLRKYNCLIDVGGENGRLIFGGIGGVEVDMLPPNESRFDVDSSLDRGCAIM